MEMTANIFDNIINTAQDCVFWKDCNRRFVGVNQAFLDFYGFESADELIGKTDEDMGWHSDPEPYRQDELRVLEGQSTYKVLGKCMVKDEERDIIASKKPIFENGEIIGLVGSFIDVTDVLKRQGNKPKEHFVYNVRLLRRYPYFDKLLDEVSINDILDPLTGLISRGYFYDFVKYMASHDTPFSYTILDLDNFKQINDSCGHNVGDEVLKKVSFGLAEYTKDYCLIGRFGGDELLIINTRDTNYNDLKKFFENIYTKEQILRTNVNINGHELFITGTSGCAVYPYDSDNLDGLFSLADKTLYHGKSIGRNCYTIYIEEKHKDIDIQSLAKKGLYTNMSNLMMRMQSVSGFEARLDSIIGLLRNQLHLTDLYYVGAKGRLHSVIDQSLDMDASDISSLTDDEVYTCNNLDDIKKESPAFASTMEQLGLTSIMITQIGLNNKVLGYLICAEPNSHRIWQEDECGLMYFIAKSLAAHINLSNESIPE